MRASVPRRICGTRLGIVGSGRIRGALAARTNALGFQVWASDPAVADEGDLGRGHPLLRALSSGRTGGAALDVLPVEPPTDQHPPPQAPRLIITPHAAWYSEEGAQALQRLAAEEAARILLGQPPRCPVNQVVSSG